MKIKRILLCEDSLEGILSAVYEAYDSRYGLHDIGIELLEAADRQTVLFSEYKTVATNTEHAASVAAAIKKKISKEAFWTVFRAACADADGKADAIYRFIMYGLYYGNKVMDALAEPAVQRVIQLSGKVGRETEHLYGFLRFESAEISGQSFLFARIRPKHQQLRQMGTHFSARYPKENFVICDVGRSLAFVHRTGGSCDFFKYDTAFFENEAASVAAEDIYKGLWQSFFKAVMISQRENRRQQMTMMPKRFWEYMPEMSEGNVLK